MKTMKKWKLIILTICLLIITTLIFPATALARGNNLKDTVNQGEVLDQNVVLYGPAVVMDGVINGDLIALGTDIKINGEVNGDMAVIGKNVLINGPVSGNVYISALFLVMGPQASIGQDVYFIGNSINSQAGSTISRDLNVIGLESELTGAVNRRVNALVGPVTLAQKIYDFLLSKGWWPKSLQIKPRSFQDGSEQLPAPVMAFGLVSVRNISFSPSSAASETVLNALSASQAPARANAIDVQRVQAWGVSLLRNLVTLLILGLLTVWLAPAQLSMASEQTRIKPWRALLAGLLVFVVGWIVALLILVLILALAFFFYWVSLPTLGFFTGAIGMMTLGLAVSIFWLSIAFFSKIVIAYLVGSLIFKRFFPQYAQTRIWPFLTGVILYALLASIPYLGWLIAVITTLFGLGAIWMLSSTRKQTEDQSVAQVEAEGESQDLSVASEG
jgi:cytoskeletal protein CcmA (bactofilin family)